MVKESKKNKFSIEELVYRIMMSILGLLFIIYGSIAVFENRISAKGSFLRGMGWEADGLPAIGMGCISIYIGAILIYYTFRK